MLQRKMMEHQKKHCCQTWIWVFVLGAFCDYMVGIVLHTQSINPYLSTCTAGEVAIVGFSALLLEERIWDRERKKERKRKR